MPESEQANVRRISDYQQSSQASSRDGSLKVDDGGGTFEGMDKERLARLEGAFDGVRSNQTILMSAVGLVSALLIGLASFTVVQNVGINARISELPGKINSDFRDITKTLSEAITASKQQAPQVVLLPAPNIRYSDGPGLGPAPQAPAPNGLPAPPNMDQKPN
jgi:hypothetical protein